MTSRVFLVATCAAAIALAGCDGAARPPAKGAPVGASGATPGGRSQSTGASSVSGGSSTGATATSSSGGTSTGSSGADCSLLPPLGVTVEGTCGYALRNISWYADHAGPDAGEGFPYHSVGFWSADVDDGSMCADGIPSSADYHRLTFSLATSSDTLNTVALGTYPIWPPDNALVDGGVYGWIAFEHLYPCTSGGPNCSVQDDLLTARSGSVTLTDVTAAHIAGSFSGQLTVANTLAEDGGQISGTFDIDTCRY